MNLTPQTLRYCYEPDHLLCNAALEDHAKSWEDEVAQLEEENERLSADVLLFASATRDYLIVSINNLKRKERESRLGGAEQEDLKWAENHLNAIDKHYPSAKYGRENIYWYFDKRER